MQPSFSQLVWLGAHTATEPSDLLQCAKRITLFEAREAACLALQQKLPHENIAVIQALLTVEKQTATFTEYNLAEFSATQQATGLHKLFPGLKALNTTPQTGTAVCDAISGLALSDDNNLLIVDIADSSLALLTAIGESNQLKSFSAIYVQTANEPLYAGAATIAEITAFLQTQGYVLQQTLGNDPDLPWLSFGLNPLWNSLQQAQETNNLISAELIQIKLQLSAAQQEVIANKQHVEQVKSEHAQQMESVHAQLNASKQELPKQEARINEISTALTAANKAKQDAEQQLVAIKQQLTATQQELATAKQSIELTKTEHKQQLEAANHQVSASKQELQKQEARLNESNTALAAANKAKQDAEQQLAGIKQQLTAVQQELATAKQNAELAKTEHKQQLETANKAKQTTEQQLATVKAEKEAVLKLQKENAAKFSSDAQIDEVISDLSGFFTGKFITYVDVGAYTGEILEKIVGSKKISVREAHLYEPNPKSFKVLKERFSETKIVSFHTNNCAIGDSEQQVTLLPAQSMTKIISSGDLSDSRQDVFVSDVKNLDSEINKITERHIHLLKIDVEGYEMEVLRGAEQLLKNQLADVIYIEVGFNKNGTQQTYMADIDNYLQGCGYRVFKIYEQKNEWIEDSPLLRRCNFAYMSTSFAKANPFKLTMTIAELKNEVRKLTTAAIESQK